METLAETSLPATGLRRPDHQLLPNSPEQERDHLIMGSSPGGSSGGPNHHHHHHLLEDHSQSSQDDSGSVVSPGVHPEPEETIENIEKELSESCADTDSQSNPACYRQEETTETEGGAATIATEQPDSRSLGIIPAAVGAATMAANGAALPKMPGGKPMAMREFDRKMSKVRGRPKRKTMVAMYQSETGLRYTPSWNRATGVRPDT
ncbi:hypothetical protein AND_008816 [Anopheles darlingi]|uniref:Uncharacterized protein n=1 Tax=Anopheles darlingi TaxID=43151 RepID=W5J9R4_ANODA|nr:hypothetical protein AND_008816 [Anopheles darlingi]